ncbi:MAG: hypothetical protein RJB25_1498 [Bacteroidota bacterium]
MYAGRPGGSQSIPSVGTKPTAADKQPFIARLEIQRLPVIKPFTQNSVHPPIELAHSLNSFLI